MGTITRRRNSWKISSGMQIVDIPRLDEREKKLAGVIQTRFGFLSVQSSQGVVREGVNEGQIWSYSDYEFIWKDRIHSLWESRFRNRRGLAQVGHRFVREVVGQWALDQAECAT